MSFGEVKVTYTTSTGRFIDKKIQFIPPERSRYESVEDFKSRIDVYIAKKVLNKHIRSSLAKPVLWKTDLGYRNF